MTKRQLLRMLERERIAFAAERAVLIERMAHLADRPLPDLGWSADGDEERRRAERLEDRRRFVPDPEQLP